MDQILIFLLFQQPVLQKDNFWEYLFPWDNKYISQDKDRVWLKLKYLQFRKENEWAGFLKDFQQLAKTSFF